MGRGGDFLSFIINLNMWGCMERDLCYLMENGADFGSQHDYNSDDCTSREFTSRDLGTAMTFAEMMTEDSLSDLVDSMDTHDPEELLEALEMEQNKNKVTRISLKDRKAEVPAFEQYVYAKCGIAG